MRWASTVATQADLSNAAHAAAEEVARALDGARPDILFVFVTAHHAQSYQTLPRLLEEHFPGCPLLGCSAEAVIGDAMEVEDSPGLALTAAWLPGVEVDTFHLAPHTVAELDGTEAWEEHLGISAGETRAMVLLPDPFTCNVDALLERLEGAFPAVVKVGGLMSGTSVMGGGALYCGDEVHRSGAAMLTLSGSLRVDTIVAQGCRPIGEPLFVTRCHKNIILELDGQPPLSVMRDLIVNLSPRDRDLFKKRLHIGLVMRDHQDSYQQGDYLIRNILGMHPEDGSITIGATPSPNQVVHLHLHDAESSRQDLIHQLAAYDARTGRSPAGVLLFECLSRGTHLYDVPNHDSDTIRVALGGPVIGGFFCNGEIGPVNGRVYVHGFTSAMALFSPEH